MGAGEHARGVEASNLIRVSVRGRKSGECWDGLFEVGWIMAGRCSTRSQGRLHRFPPEVSSWSRSSGISQHASPFTSCFPDLTT
jgi:hypothetical protein